MTEESKIRRKRLDHELYMRHQEERKKKQRDYYIANRETILIKTHERRQFERLMAFQ